MPDQLLLVILADQAGSMGQPVCVLCKVHTSLAGWRPRVGRLPAPQGPAHPGEKDPQDLRGRKVHGVPDSLSTKMEVDKSIGKVVDIGQRYLIGSETFL